MSLACLTHYFTVTVTSISVYNDNLSLEGSQCRVTISVSECDTLVMSVRTVFPSDCHFASQANICVTVTVTGETASQVLITGVGEMPR